MRRPRIGLGWNPVVDRVVHREYLGRSPFLAFGPQRLLEPRCEGIVCLTALPHGDREEVVILTHPGVEQKPSG